MNPAYYETFELFVEFDKPEDADPIIVCLWDYDKFSSSNDMLGRVIVDMTDASFDPAEIGEPKWYKLDMGKPGTAEGEILLGFTALPKG